MVLGTEGEGGPEGPASLVDDLIPPPWSARTRILAAAVALVVVVAVLALAMSGLVAPRLVHGDSWGSSVDGEDPDRLRAERIAPIRNAGWVAVTLHELLLPDIDGVRWGQVVGLPAVLAPGQVLEVVIPFEVAGCTLDAEGYDVFELRAASRIGPSRVVGVPSLSSGEPTTSVTHLDGRDGEALVLPAWPEQPPSWILDSIAAHCSDLEADVRGPAAARSFGPSPRMDTAARLG